MGWCRPSIRYSSIFWSHIPLLHPRHPQNTVWNIPLEIFSSKYVLLWIQEQKRAFTLDFWVICNFSPMGGHFCCLFGHTYPPHTPRHPQNTLWNTPLEIFSSKYVLVWVREQNRAFIMDFWVICNFSPMGGHLSPFWLHIPPTPPTPPKILCGILLWRYFLQNMFWFGYGNNIEPSYWIFEWFAIFFLWVVICLLFGHTYPFHTPPTPPKYSVEYSPGDIFLKTCFGVGTGTK